MLEGKESLFFSQAWDCKVLNNLVGSNADIFIVFTVLDPSSLAAFVLDFRGTSFHGQCPRPQL